METRPIQIRLAIHDDLPNVKICTQEAYAKYVKRIGQEPAPMVADFANQIELGQVSIALCGSSFFGYVVFYQEADYLHLENIAVLPAHAGKGIGKKLIEYVEHLAYKKGLSAVELYTNEAMTENLTIYPKLGYSETKRVQQDGFSRVFFRKLIQSTMSENRLK